MESKSSAQSQKSISYAQMLRKGTPVERPREYSIKKTSSSTSRTDLDNASTSAPDSIHRMSLVKDAGKAAVVVKPGLTFDGSGVRAAIDKDMQHQAPECCAQEGAVSKPKASDDNADGTKKRLSLLLACPAEIRNKIWSMALTHEKPLIIEKDTSTGLPRLRPTRGKKHRMALLKVNKQLAAECEAFFFSQNDFRVQDTRKVYRDGRRVMDRQRHESELLCTLMRDILPEVARNHYSQNFTINLFRRPYNPYYWAIYMRHDLSCRLSELRGLRAEFPGIKCTIQFGEVSWTHGTRSLMTFVVPRRRAEEFTVDVDLENLAISIRTAADEMESRYLATGGTLNGRIYAISIAANTLYALATEVEGNKLD